MADAKSKGRHAHGERIGSAVLTTEKVQSIRAARSSGATMQSLADLYCISLTAVFRVVHRKSWAHVP